MLFDGLPNTKKEDEKNVSLFDDLPTPSTAPLKHSNDEADVDRKKSEGVLEKDENKESDAKQEKVEGVNFDFLPTTLRKRKKPSKIVAPQRRSIGSSNRAIAIDDSNVLNIHEDTNSTAALVPSSPIQDEYEEPQSLTDRHASIFPADMYVPSMPNDYLAYRQKRENELLKSNLEEQAKKTIEMQNKLRLKIEEERKKAMDKAIETGNFDEIIQSRLGSNARSMGRGRGLNNLPAWLLKKQKESETERIQSS